MLSDSFIAKIAEQSKNDLLQKQLIKINDVFYNRYHIIEVIGSGGMGKVYKAKDQANNEKLVAIKSMLNTTDKVNVKRFLREYKFLKKFNNHNLINAVDLIQVSGKLFMILEYVEGISLKDFISSRDEITVWEKLVIGNNIARAVQMLNEVNIIHRDVKPSNIMFNEFTGIVKLLDLGVGKDLMRLDKTNALSIEGMPIGTLTYMAPEQINGNLAKNSDIFSLAVTLYQLFLWEEDSPFDDTNPIAVMTKIDSEELEPLDKKIFRLKKRIKKQF